MAQVTVSSGFHYPYDLVAVTTRLRDKLDNSGREELDYLINRFTDRDRALEDFLRASPVFDQVLTEEGTSSTTFTDLATVGPVVTARLPKGAAIVHGGGTLQATTAESTLQIALYIDGVQFFNTIAILNVPNPSASQGDPVWITGGSTFLISDLQPGDHEFKLRYRSFTGTFAVFSNRFLQVTPLTGGTNA